MPHMYDGRTVGGYKVERTLGEGQFARAMRARDVDGNPVFLKLYTEPVPADGWYTGFLKHQDRLRAALDAIASSEGGSALSVVEGAHEYFEHDGYYWQAKEWVEGTSLREVLDASADAPDSFTDDQRLTNALVLLYALRKVHGRGIVHCDLKPDNVFMMDVKGTAVGRRVKLVDFDFSFFEGEAPPWIAGGIGYVTTPGWASPEHLRGEAPTRASDVFTTGLILYELLCGAFPFEEKDQALKRDFPKPADMYPDLPRAVSNVIWRMLDPSPSGRPEVGEVHQALLAAGPLGRRPSRATSSPAADRARPMPVRVRLSVPDHIPLRFHKTTVFTRQMGKTFGHDYRYLEQEQFQIVRNEAAGRWEVEALAGTTYPTKLNGDDLPAGEARELREGDLIQVGDLRISVAFESE